jgi:hypothetical protein
VTDPAVHAAAAELLTVITTVRDEKATREARVEAALLCSIATFNRPWLGKEASRQS